MEINERTKNLTWQEKLEFVAKNFDGATFSSSFGIEDQVITDFIAEKNLPIEIFTLDTGRLPQETYDVWQRTLEKYSLKISVFYPDADEISNFVNREGINAFYQSKELRLTCCEIRKIKPLQRALKGKNLWISGLRKEHSNTRATKDFFEKDEALNLIKFYPLLEVSEEELWQKIQQKNIPFNQLYKSGYRSIGCAPCTRATSAGEDIRAGRWWWEDDEKKECGLHRG
jgi:phosphoadenosine phosphosulfate reductase